MNKRSFDETKNAEIKNQKYWSSFYSKEAASIQEQLKSFGFDKNDILTSSKCSKYFNNIVSIAQLLEIDELNIINFISEIRELILEKFKDQSTMFNLEKENVKLNEKLLKLNLIYEPLIRDLNSLNAQLPEDKEKLEEIKGSLQFIQNKVDKYTVEIEDLESYNKTVDKNIYHERIVEDYQELKRLEEEISRLKAEHERYQDLPPSISLARTKLQTLRNEIDQIDKEIEYNLNWMH